MSWLVWGLSFVVLMTGGVLFFLTQDKDFEFSENPVKCKRIDRIAIISGIFLMGLGICGMFFANDMEEKENYRDFTTYTVYLDGVQVDSDKIDISLYNAKIDDEKQVVYITKR